MGCCASWRAATRAPLSRLHTPAPCCGTQPPFRFFMPMMRYESVCAFDDVMFINALFINALLHADAGKRPHADGGEHWHYCTRLPSLCCCVRLFSNGCCISSPFKHFL